MNHGFSLGRYPTNIIIEEFRKADKSKGELTLENEEPWFSIFMEGFESVGDDLLLDVISHIEEFDNKVQSFCEELYHYRKQNSEHKRYIENYMVGLHWIEFRPDEITFGYYGECVNIELRAKFTNKNGDWETVGIYYQ